MAPRSPPTNRPLPGNERWYVAMLDAIEQPMILAQADGTLIHANRSGLALLRRGPGLCLRRAAVFCRDITMAPAFDAALRAVAASGQPLDFQFQPAPPLPEPAPAPQEGGRIRVIPLHAGGGATALLLTWPPTKSEKVTNLQ